MNIIKTAAKLIENGVKSIPALQQRYVNLGQDRWMDGWMDGTLYFNTAFYQIKIYSNIKIWFT